MMSAGVQIPFQRSWQSTLPRLCVELRVMPQLASVPIPLIAVVDDDEALSSSLADLMRSAGYRAVSFHSAEALLAWADRFSLSCIVADIHMPGMGGLKLLGAVRAQGMPTPVILITALTDQTLDKEAAAQGAMCLLRKPFEMSALLNQVERSLRK
jgi:FixJ family two-component response regulator